MSRTPLDVIEIEFGEDGAYAPPAEADRWSAFRRTDILATMDLDGAANGLISHGGHTPQWVLIGGWNITADAFIPPPTADDRLRGEAAGFENIASAAGFTIKWNIIAAHSVDGLREMLMVVAYVNGKAILKTFFRAPPSSAIDPAVISAQERRYLQSLLVARDKRAGAGGSIKIDLGEGSGEEFESLAVLDRRIAECRARIAWFEAAAEGNNLPRLEAW